MTSTLFWGGVPPPPNGTVTDEKQNTKIWIHQCSTCPSCLNIHQWLSIHGTQDVKWIGKCCPSYKHLIYSFNLMTLTGRTEKKKILQKNLKAKTVLCFAVCRLSNEPPVSLKKRWRVTCTLLKDHRKNTETLWRIRVKNQRE